ncbi:Caskin-2 [Halotydeus destructor]|nr:Caskin-2 [Halotydeus destructor]
MKKSQQQAQQQQPQWPLRTMVDSNGNPTGGSQHDQWAYVWTPTGQPGQQPLAKYGPPSAQGPPQPGQLQHHQHQQSIGHCVTSRPSSLPPYLSQSWSDLQTNNCDYQGNYSARISGPSKPQYHLHAPHQLPHHLSVPLNNVRREADMKVQSWLKGIRFPEYTLLFVQAGYDLPTISRMTPEDLTAIGITKPAHRRKLKSEIQRLNIDDGIPNYRPDTMHEWLTLLRLEEYVDILCAQGYDTIDRVTELTWEDLEEIGIKKLGHEKRLMLAIKRIRDLKRHSGAVSISSSDSSSTSSVSSGSCPDVTRSLMVLANRFHQLNVSTSNFQAEEVVINTSALASPARQSSSQSTSPSSPGSTSCSSELKTFQPSPEQELVAVGKNASAVVQLHHHQQQQQHHQLHHSQHPNQALFQAPNNNNSLSSFQFAHEDLYGSTNSHQQMNYGTQRFNSCGQINVQNSNYGYNQSATASPMRGLNFRQSSSQSVNSESFPPPPPQAYLNDQLHEEIDDYQPTYGTVVRRTWDDHKSSSAERLPPLMPQSSFRSHLNESILSEGIYSSSLYDLPPPDPEPVPEEQLLPPPPPRPKSIFAAKWNETTNKSSLAGAASNSGSTATLTRSLSVKKPPPPPPVRTLTASLSRQNKVCEDSSTASSVKNNQPTQSVQPIVGVAYPQPQDSQASSSSNSSSSSALSRQQSASSEGQQDDAEKKEAAEEEERSSHVDKLRSFLELSPEDEKLMSAYEEFIEFSKKCGLDQFL